jgi:hypothetical protein
MKNSVSPCEVQHEDGSSTEAADLERFVSEQNIALYRKLIEARTNSDQRRTILKLLAEEVAKLK